MTEKPEKRVLAKLSLNRLFAAGWARVRLGQCSVTEALKALHGLSSAALSALKILPKPLLLALHQMAVMFSCLCWWFNLGVCFWSLWVLYRLNCLNQRAGLGLENVRDSSVAQRRSELGRLLYDVMVS